MKILVLGGTGAMGTPVVQILADRNHEVYVTTRSERCSTNPKIHYLQGNAHDLGFVKEILDESFDAVVDFMIYEPEEFLIHSNLFLDRTKQYIFLSSARVYADSPDEPITEDTPRLLEVTENRNYLSTNEYALAKAREEDVLLKGVKRNFTIIRPYITYYDERLQLGIFEKEIWLQRALEGKKIVFSRNIASKYTTLTYGYDVALRIADLIGHDCALGQVYHITTNESIKWEDVLTIYLNVLEKYLGKRPEVIMTAQSDSLLEKTNFYQIHYDREYNRIFNNEKIERDTEEICPFISIEQGLEKCLTTFLEKKQHFLFRNWKEEAVLDRISGDKSRIMDICGIKNKIKYVLYRYIIK